MASYFNSRSSFRSRKVEEDVDPMSSMTGIGDIMLVFATGLMTALVLAWSVDLGQFAEVEVGAEIEDVDEMEEEPNEGTGSYVNMGTVYQDPTTGRYYLVQEGYTDEGAASGEGDPSMEEGYVDMGNVETGEDLIEWSDESVIEEEPTTSSAGTQNEG